GRVVRAPDDAGVVLRSAPGVAELELLQADHVTARTAGQPVRGRAADAPQAQHGVGPLDGHAGVTPARRAGSPRRRTCAGGSRPAIPPPPPDASPGPGPWPSRAMPTSRRDRKSVV